MVNDALRELGGTRKCGDYKPKISDFGAVDDVGKRRISLWHKQTPGPELRDTCSIKS